MSAESSKRKSEIVRAFALQMRLARASELARSGLLLEAEDVLVPFERVPKTPEEHDLLARIYIQQGRLEMAKKRWEDAGGLAGGGAYWKELEALERYSAKQKEWRQFWAVVLMMACVASLLSAWNVFK